MRFSLVAASVATFASVASAFSVSVQPVSFVGACQPLVINWSGEAAVQLVIYAAGTANILQTRDLTGQPSGYPYNVELEPGTLFGYEVTSVSGQVVEGTATGGTTTFLATGSNDMACLTPGRAKKERRRARELH